ncbi:MAG: DUF1643 domain-containing protein [Pyrinomonadaceae bacterium]
MRLTVFSPCRTYRYSLWREFDMLNLNYAVFIGLNPSTADEVQDDPTIRRCIGFAKRFGVGALCMTNIFAYRATNPEVMKQQDDPIGPENDQWISADAKNASVIVAAWGVHGTHLDRGAAVVKLLPRLSCLGVTSKGHPRHPLYLPSDAALCEF